MTALSLSEAARATGLSRITITQAIKARWHSASRKEDGSCEICERALNTPHLWASNFPQF